MIHYLKARDFIIELAKSFGTENIRLADANDRILAEDIFADRDYPPFNRSAMDGYAINTHDWEQGIRRFKIIQVIYAGQSADNQLSTGECYKIMTGAPVPLSANAVIRREDADQQGEWVSFTVSEVKAFQSISRRGEDMRQGELIINRHSKCTSAVLSLLASLGKTSFKVECLPRVALFTTGNEVIDPEQAVTDTQIRNGNRYLLKALLKKWDIIPQFIAHIPDDKTLLTDELTRALSCDIVITCGGVSAGDADYLPEVLDTIGVKKLFHKVAIKPGKPIWCGQMLNGGLVFALPGNPLSSMVTFKLFVDAYLSASMAQQPPKTLTLPFNGKRINHSGLDEFFPVHITGMPSSARAISFNGSGDIRLGLHADALAIHPATDNELMDGDMVTCLMM